MTHVHTNNIIRNRTIIALIWLLMQNTLHINYQKWDIMMINYADIGNKYSRQINISGKTLVMS